MCKRVKMEQDAQYITDSDSDSDCDCDECIYGILRQEVKEEFVETCQLDRNNGQSVLLGTRVKKEEETSDDENGEVQVALDGGEELNHNRNDDLHEESNGTNQGSVNDQQVDKGDDWPNEPVNDDQNKCPTSKQSSSRKRKRTANRELSSPDSIKRSKRTRMSTPLDSTETVEQLSTGPRVDLMDDSVGGKGLEQSDDDNETELAEEDQGGNYKIRTIKLKCTEDGCNDEVSNRVELHDHLRGEHHISPYRCLAVGCLERFEQWGELGPHVQHNHSNISTWSCHHCTKTFNAHNLLSNHLYLYHFEGQFKCGYDGCHYDRVATFRSEIKSHQKSVHPKTRNSTIYTCQFNNCGKSFNHKGDFNHHQRIHQNEKPFKCTWNKCNYASTTGSNVIRHIRTQHFHLPLTQKKQDQLGIEDNRDPHDYLLKELDN